MLALLASIVALVAGHPASVDCVKAPATVTGYALLEPRARTAVINRDLCAEAYQLAKTRRVTFDRVFALFILVHEGEHLAGGSSWRDEAVVQCRAMHTTPAIAKRLGVVIPDGWLRYIYRTAPPAYRATPCAVPYESP